jgi:hypothetical protein
LIIELDDEELQLMSLDEIESLLDCDIVTIQVPLPSINVTNSYIDIIWDYLDASFVIESIASKFITKNLNKMWGIKHFPVYQITIESFEKNSLAVELKFLIWSFQYPQDDTHETEYADYRHLINEYEGKVTEKNLAYPEIIDDYLINLVCGAYYELEFEIISGHLSYFPERNYGFISGSKYNTSEFKVLMSSNSWIVPSAINLDDVFRENGYEGQISLLPSHLLMIDRKTVAISELGAVDIPMGQLIQAITCYEEYSSPKDEYRQKFALDGSFFQYSPEIMRLQARYKNEFIKNTSLFNIYTSEFLDFCVVSTDGANIVLFDIEKTRNNESHKFINAAKQLLSSIEDELVTDAKTDVNWACFDDEIFEQLCYDIVYHNSKFDKNTIRKMGKSRSRDGGRDIVVFTKSALGDKPKKYIFQCKLSGREKSINTSNVGSISDVIDQYGADGYGLMCNCYIDSTLFDRLDGISDSRGIDIETWSGFEIERFLSRRPLLKQRYEIT